MSNRSNPSAHWFRCGPMAHNAPTEERFAMVFIFDGCVRTWGTAAAVAHECL